MLDVHQACQPEREGAPGLSAKTGTCTRALGKNRHGHQGCQPEQAPAPGPSARACTCTRAGSQNRHLHQGSQPEQARGMPQQEWVSRGGSTAIGLGEGEKERNRIRKGRVEAGLKEVKKGAARGVIGLQNVRGKREESC